MIHKQIWSGSRSARITDMINAGKRGKLCRVLRVSGAPWDVGVSKDSTESSAVHYSQQILLAVERLDPSTPFDDARQSLLAVLAEARNAGVPEDYVNIYDESCRGVDAPREKLTHCVSGVFSCGADETGIRLHSLNDPHNDWTEITPCKQSGPRAYDLAHKVWDQVQQCATLREASDVLRRAGCKLHGYCAID